MRQSWFPICLVVGASLGACGAGCSALVSPDPGRLGGEDAAGRDSGGGSLDGGSPDDVGPARDGGSPEDTGVDPRDVGIDAAPLCASATDCVSSVPCAVGSCAGGVCSFAADDSRCPTGQRCNPASGCVPRVCATDDDCDDGNACNGEERCGGAGADPATQCARGIPLACDDGMGCTDDACDPGAGCVYVRHDERCDDMVGCTIDSCAATAGPTGCQHLPNATMCNGGCTVGATCSATGCVGGTTRDCGDSSPCTADSCDATGGGVCVHTPIDMDRDGFAAATVSGTSCAGVGGTDCDDTNGAIRPGASEICGNGRDDNCAGGIDEGCATPTGDDCATALPIVISPTTGTGSVSGNTAKLRDNYASSCNNGGGTGGNDAVYYVDVTGGDLIIDTLGASFDTVLAISDSCTPTSFVNQCNDDQDPSSFSGDVTTTTSRIFLHNLPVTPGSTLRIYILVDAFSGGSGAFSVHAATRRGSDACGVGEPLDISGGGTVFGYGGFGTSAGGSSGTCQTVTERGEGEALFRMAIPTDRTIARLEATAMTGGFFPDLYLRDGSCTGTERTCVHGSSTTTIVSGVSYPAGTTPGRAFFFLDGITGATATYSLEYDP